MDFDVANISPRDSYKLLAAVVVPRPIALVSTVSAGGVTNAAPFSFFNLLGSDPPTLGLNVANNTNNSAKDTLENILATRNFVVHLVNEALAQQMNICAIDFPSGISEIDAAQFVTRAATMVAAPIIVDAPVHLECVLDQVVRSGNNNIIIGTIVAFGISDDVLDLKTLRVDTPNLNLIGRMHGSGWYARTSDLFNMERITYAEWLESHGS